MQVSLVVNPAMSPAQNHWAKREKQNNKITDIFAGTYTHISVAVI